MIYLIINATAPFFCVKKNKTKSLIFVIRSKENLKGVKKNE